jgi:hypothetical protein
VNGYPSEPVRIAQGLRQGDPLSPLLYNIVLEPLLAFLRRQLTGLVLPSFNLCTLAYADDMLVAVRDQVDVGILVSGLRLHAHASNARVNRHKSEIMPLNGIDITTPFLTVRPGQSVRYLGVFFKDGAVDTRLQQESMLRSMRQRVESWKDRDLSLHGRVLCLNVFVLSWLWFAAHVIPLDDGVLRKVNEVSRRFLWNGRKPLVDFEKLQQPRSKGGLGLLHAAKQAKALLGKWFVRVLNPDGPPWCRLARALLTRHLAAAGRVPSDLLAGSDWHRHRKEMAPLWRSLLSAWDGMKGGLINSGRLSSSMGLALSALPVSTRTVDGKPYKAIDALRRAGINCAHNIIYRCAQRRHIHVEEVDSTIRRRLRKAWTEGRFELAPMFRASDY